jgi:hypothetical protein
MKAEATFWFRVALTVTLVRIVGAKALQISAVPLAVFVRLTSAQVKVEPVVKITPFTCALVPLAAPSVPMNANSSSFPEVVKNAAVVIELLVVDCVFKIFWSMAIAFATAELLVRLKLAPVATPDTLAVTT